MQFVGSSQQLKGGRSHEAKGHKWQINARWWGFLSSFSHPEVLIDDHNVYPVPNTLPQIMHQWTFLLFLLLRISTHLQANSLIDMTLISHTSQGCIFIDGEVKSLGDHNFVLSLHNPTPPTARAPCKCPQRCPARKNWVALPPSHYHLTFPFLILRSKFLTQDLKVFIGQTHFKHTRISSELIKNIYSLRFDSNSWFRDSLFAWLINIICVTLYNSLSDVPESRVWFASKNLTPWRMHWNAFLIGLIIAECHSFPYMYDML